MSELRISGGVLDGALRSSDGCATPEEVHRVVIEAEREPDALLRLEAHAASCPACGAELELARAYESATGTPEEDVDWIVGELRRRRRPAPDGERPLKWRPRRAGPAAVAARRWAMAAALVLASGLGLIVAFSARTPKVGAPPALDTVRGGEVLVTEPRGDLALVPKRIAWNPLPGAATYGVRVVGVDDVEIWSGTATEDSISIPDSSRRKLESLVRYRILISAYDSSGRRLGGSEPTEFRIEAAAPDRR